MAAKSQTINESAVDKTTKDVPADFERAAEVAGFGVFNLLLIFVAIPGQFGSVFESSTMSYILPVAECDLKLSLFDKGILNAVTYGGMIISAVLWGYIADIKGRRKVLAYGFLADAVCVLGSAMSQNFSMLVVFKFFGGLIVNGPGAVLYTYLLELHSAKQRPRVLMSLGVCDSIAVLTLPLLAWGIFPRDWDFQLFGTLNVHNWQIFLFVCAVPSLICGILMLFMPESPKFLMSQGHNAEALRVFQMMHAINSRTPKDTFPIKALVEEVPTRDVIPDATICTIEEKPAHKTKSPPKSFLDSLRAGMTQIKPMFRKPLLGRSIHCYTMQFCILLGLNTIRLWLPQLFASIAAYEATQIVNGTQISANLCTILEYNVNTTANSEELSFAADPTCSASKHISMDMYRNNIIVALSGFVGYAFAGAIIRSLGAKHMLTLGLFISGCFGMTLYWSTNGSTTVIISAIFVTVGAISASSLLGAVVEYFPTQLRTLVVGVTMMFGRLGALSGNLHFPVLIEIGCLPPFVMVCFALLCAAALSIILPNPKKVNFT